MFNFSAKEHLHPLSDHIHEWRRWRRLIKAPIPDQLLAEWFTKSLLPPIAQYVAMGSSVTEEQAISRAQYLDLVYSQSGTLYDLIPQAPCPSTDPAKPPAEVPVHGIVGSIQSPSAAKPAKQTQTATPSTPKVSAKVNSIQRTQTLSNKKKGKYRNKKPRNQLETP